MVHAPPRSTFVELPEVRLHCLEQGAAEGKPVVLLHGFPETSRSWRHQLPALADAGYRVLAPDLRGFGRSSQPRGVLAYGAERVAEDVSELIRKVSPAKKVRLVGHDWGGLIAYHVAMQTPELLERLVILNAPHPESYRRELRHADQRQRARYVLRFQLPFLPERTLRANGWKLFRSIFQPPRVRAGAFSEEDVEAYVKSFAAPGAMTAALNYYRAALWEPARAAPIRLPTTVLYGADDLYLTHASMTPSSEWVSPLQMRAIPGVGHFAHEEAPQLLNELLLDELGRALPTA